MVEYLSNTSYCRTLQSRMSLSNGLSRHASFSVCENARRTPPIYEYTSYKGGQGGGNLRIRFSLPSAHDKTLYYSLRKRTSTTSLLPPPTHTRRVLTPRERKPITQYWETFERHTLHDQFPKAASRVFGLSRRSCNLFTPTVFILPGRIIRARLWNANRPSRTRARGCMLCMYAGFIDINTHACALFSPSPFGPCINLTTSLLRH